MDVWGRTSAVQAAQFNRQLLSGLTDVPALMLNNIQRDRQYRLSNRPMNDSQVDELGDELGDQLGDQLGDELGGITDDCQDPFANLDHTREDHHPDVQVATNSDDDGNNDDNDNDDADDDDDDDDGQGESALLQEEEAMGEFLEDFFGEECFEFPVTAVQATPPANLPKTAQPLPEVDASHIESKMDDVYSAIPGYDKMDSLQQSKSRSNFNFGTEILADIHESVLDVRPVLGCS